MVKFDMMKMAGHTNVIVDALADYKKKKRFFVISLVLSMISVSILLGYGNIPSAMATAAIEDNPGNGNNGGKTNNGKNDNTGRNNGWKNGLNSPNMILDENGVPTLRIIEPHVAPTYGAAEGLRLGPPTECPVSLCGSSDDGDGEGNEGEAPPADQGGDNGPSDESHSDDSSDNNDVEELN